MDERDKQAWARIESHFDQLWELDPDTRAARLAALDDPRLAAQVRALFDASESNQHLFDLAPATTLMPMPDPLFEVGRRIGAWRIIGLLGRGGMGEVYRAERADGQFRKPVALKLARADALLRPDLFDNERQILATLEHPGIARLIDGGIDGDGRAYMVMELVEGIDLLKYCRDRSLGLPERLALFEQVCAVVTYAHLHLIVHRDLKPSNILVSEDGKVKLLDFGIAKLLQAGISPDSQQTLALMTPEYAAPEQLEGRPATTATDVYALGVLLYQLLAGVAPWNLRELPVPAALQRLLNTDPKALSESAAANTESPVPARLLRGDLDAIVAKALRRESEARYPTAAEMWADIQRHLEYRPVLARGGARSYLARRFLRRYRLLVVATAAIILTLSAGLAGTLWQAHRVVRERNLYEAQDARTKAVLDYLALMLSSSGQGVAGQSTTLKQMLENGATHLDQQFASRPADYASVVEFFGELYSALDDEESAVSLQQTFIDSPAAAAVPETAAEVRVTLAQSRMRQGDLKAAAAVLAPAQAFWESKPGQYGGRLARSRVIEGQIAKASGELEKAIAIDRRGLAEIDGAAGVSPEDASNLENSLALALMQAGEFEEADSLMQKVRAFRESEGRVTDDLLTAIQNQGAIALNRGNYARAEEILRDAIDQRRKTFGPSGGMAAAELNLAKALNRQNRFQEAIEVLHDAQPMAVRYTGPDSPIVLGTGLSEAESQLGLGELTTAGQLADDAQKRIAAKFGEHHPLYASALMLQARLCLKHQQPLAARTLADRARDILDKAGAAGRLQQAPLQTLQAEIAAQGG